MHTYFNCRYCDSALPKASNKYNAYCDMFCKNAHAHDERQQPRLVSARIPKSKYKRCDKCGRATLQPLCYACTVELASDKAPNVSHETSKPKRPKISQLGLWE